MNLFGVPFANVRMHPSHHTKLSPTRGARGQRESACMSRMQHLRVESRSPTTFLMHCRNFVARSLDNIARFGSTPYASIRVTTRKRVIRSAEWVRSTVMRVVYAFGSARQNGEHQSISFSKRLPHLLMFLNGAGSARWEREYNS